MAEREAYGTHFPERVLTAIVRRLDISWVLPPAPKLPEDFGAIDATSALADVVRDAKMIGGDAFDCPFDFDGAPRAFTAAEIADVLLDIAMRSHRAAGDDHASEPYDTLRTRPCLRPYIVRLFLAFCYRAGTEVEQVLAFANAVGIRLGHPSPDTRTLEASHSPAGVNGPFVLMGELHVGSAAQPDILIEFMQSHRFVEPMGMAVFAYLQEKIETAGRALTDDEFRAALRDFALHASVAHSGSTPSA
ncbi:hypothetical protein HY634_01145 [Candidatus Uhrbacteria bacterium]|nr:hypothetical protein [Candidatus Uhrbacteria bacterium]